MSVSLDEAGHFGSECNFWCCTSTSDGKVVAVPWGYPSIVTFDPAEKSCEEVGQFEGRVKFRCCANTSDGKVVLVPYGYPSIVIFDPTEKALEEVGNFEGSSKFCCCANTSDGKVVLVPCDYPSIVIFDPASKTYEEVGQFEGDGKFACCTSTSDGKIVLVPLHYPFVVIFDPIEKSYEEVGPFEGIGKFECCTNTSDGKVLLVPSCHPSIVILDPAEKSYEEVGHFDLFSFSCCMNTSDGKIVLAPACYPSLVIVDPVVKSYEEVGKFEGSFKFRCCTNTPDGKIVFVPRDYPSVVIFDPAKKSYDEVGRLEWKYKFSCCTNTSDGKVVLVPGENTSIVVATCPAWQAAALKKTPVEQTCALISSMWKDRSFADVKIIAGRSQGEQKEFLAHRVVLASRSAFFQALFHSSFRESFESTVHLLEDAETVEAALHHTYTGELGSVDILHLLPLAHRLALEDCMVDCATNLHVVSKERVPEAFMVLSPLMGHSAIDAAWAKLADRVHEDRSLLEDVLSALAAQSIEPLKETACHATCEPGLLAKHAATQTLASAAQELFAQDVEEIHNSASTGAVLQSPNSTQGDEIHYLGSSSLSPPASQFIILHFHRCPSELNEALFHSKLAQDLQMRGVNVFPDWARGAKVLIEGLTEDDLRHNGYDPTSLRPWHVLTYVEDVSLVFESLRRIPYCRRPRAKAKMSRRGSAHRKSAMEPKRVVPSLSLSSFGVDPPEKLHRLQFGASGDAPLHDALGHGDGQGPSLEDAASEDLTTIDTETAAAIARAISASFLEDHYLQGAIEPIDCERVEVEVQNTFVCVNDNSSSYSPRTLRTI